MHYSEFVLDWNYVKNPYEIHKRLWKAFPDRPDADRPFLFNLQWSRPGNNARALMLSLIKPASDKLEPGVKMLRTKPMSFDGLKSGDILRFTLTANPVKRLNVERCRVPLTRDDQRLAWLAKKLEDCAEILEAQITSTKILHFRKGHRLGKLATVTFSGLLKVTNQHAFLDKLKTGIGPAKAFGCGLMLVGRA